MDDVERIQKISAMSQELKKFGFSNNTLDAIEGAKGLLMSEEDQQDSLIFSEEDSVTELNNRFSRYRQNSEKQMQEMKSNIINLHAQVKELLETVSELKTRNIPPPQKEPSPSYSTETPSSPQVSSPQQQVEVQKPLVESQERKEEKPYYEKQGHYSPENVKVEDFFYYGHK